MQADAGGPIADLLAVARPEEAAIRSRWQHGAVLPWRGVEPTPVCEVRVMNLDLGRWAGFPVAFVRWCTDRSVDDCGLEQLFVIAGPFGCGPLLKGARSEYHRI